MAPDPIRPNLAHVKAAPRYCNACAIWSVDIRVLQQRTCVSKVKSGGNSGRSACSMVLLASISRWPGGPSDLFQVVGTLPTVYCRSLNSTCVTQTKQVVIAVVKPVCQLLMWQQCSSAATLSLT